MARQPQQPTDQLFGDLSYADNRKLYAGAPIEEVEKTLSILDKRYETNKKGYNDMYAAVTANKVKDVDTPFREQAMTALNRAKPYLDNNDYIDMASVNENIARDISANIDYRNAVDNAKQIEEGDKLEAQYRANNKRVLRFDNPKEYKGARNPDGTPNEYKHRVEIEMDYDKKQAEIAARVIADTVGTILTPAEAAGYLKHGSIEGISPEKIQKLGEAMYNAYSGSPEYGQQYEKLTKKDKLGHNDAVAQIYKEVISHGKIRTYYKENLDYDANEFAKINAAKTKSSGGGADVEMVIPSTATAIPVWNDGNSYKNVAGITNSLKQIDQELANYEVEQKDFLDKNGLSISLVDLSNFDAMGIHNGVGDPELSQVFYSKGSTSNSTNSLMPISLQGNQTNVQGENKPIPLELYGQAKELLEKRQVILAKKKYTQDYLDEHARKVGEKRGKPNWKPTQLDNVTEYAKTYADSYVYAHSLYPNTLLSTFSELLLERPEIAGMKLATNSLSDFQKKQWQEAYNDAINEAKGASPDDKEMYKELNQLIQKDSEGFSSNAITNSFPKYKGFDLGKEFEDQLMSRFSGTDADGNSTAPNAARYSGEKGEDGKGMLNKEDAEKFKGINKADQTQGNPIKILGWRKDANSPTGFVYDFRIKSDGDLGKVYEADVPANFTQVMDFYGLFNRTLIPNDTNNELNTLDGNLWRQAVDSKHKNGVRVPYGANSYKAEIEALTRGDYEGNAPTNFYKLHLPYVDNTGKKRYKTDIFHSYAEAEAAYKQALLNVLSTAQPKVYAEIMATLGQNGITDLQGVVDYNTGKK